MLREGVEVTCSGREQDHRGNHQEKGKQQHWEGRLNQSLLSTRMTLFFSPCLEIQTPLSISHTLPIPLNKMNSQYLALLNRLISPTTDTVHSQQRQKTHTHTHPGTLNLCHNNHHHSIHIYHSDLPVRFHCPVSVSQNGASGESPDKNKHVQDTGTQSVYVCFSCFPLFAEVQWILTQRMFVGVLRSNGLCQEPSSL